MKISAPCTRMNHIDFLASRNDSRPRRLPFCSLSKWLLPVVLAAGCAGEARQPATAQEAAAPNAPSTYTNPIIDVDLPDPGVIWDNGTFYLTHTMGGPNEGWGLWKSPDARTWSFDRHLLTAANKPAWMKSDFWAPEIHRIKVPAPNGASRTRYVLPFTSRSNTNNRLCVGLAFADALTGPYKVQDKPLVEDEVALIDSDVFQDDDGKVYFLWKRDGPPQGNAGIGGSLRIRQLTPDATAFAPGTSDKVLLQSGTPIMAGQNWERGLIEAPWMMKHGGMYYLFYSGGFIGPDLSYRVGVARSKSPLGAFERYTSNPILQNNAMWGGPGHGSFFTDAEGTDWHIYHARHVDSPNDPGDNPPGKGRVILMDRVIWADGWPTFLNGSPSTTPQPLPQMQKPAAQAQAASAEAKRDAAGNKAVPPRTWNPNVTGKTIRLPDRKLDR